MKQKNVVKIKRFKFFTIRQSAIQLIASWFHLRRVENKLEKAGIEFEALGYASGDLMDALFSLIGIPSDNWDSDNFTREEILKLSDERKMFCRDGIVDMVFDAGDDPKVEIFLDCVLDNYEDWIPAERLKLLRSKDQ